MSERASWSSSGEFPTAGLWRVLNRVYDGERAFAPADDSDAARRAFDREVEALVELEARGLIEGLRVRPDNARPDCRYHSASVAGVTGPGARVVERRRP